MKTPPIMTPDDPRITETVKARFWARVDKRGPNECWIWTGAVAGVGGVGYGQCRLDDMTKVYAHRLALLIDGESFTDDAPLALHSCDNPRCCNPGHLHTGNRVENAREMIARGRGLTGDRAPFRRYPTAVPRGQLHSNASLSERKVRKIRAKAEQGFKISEIARAYRTSHSNVSRIVRGKSWKHLLDGWNPGQDKEVWTDPLKLRKTEVAGIRRLFADGVPVQLIADVFNLSENSVKGILIGFLRKDCKGPIFPANEIALGSMSAK